ncbi:glycosyltransferase [Rhodococcoides kyotonense]|uniref:Glycosyl transferase family 28 C-terminal domain-containing protein n=1 Tax=Rhodococcoides kyotonense TaxID=398843 RepID=A0A177Y6T9_9NOCA|nr:glycosyltransferase [Rhodococcus kyotonensis]OAK51120.1 hypothetical protein A3K89_12870 [Rhodococcus kyotonensis]
MIGYYAHHHGSGHVTRATSIAAASDEQFVVLSSRKRPSHSNIEWVTLPLDVDEDVTPIDPTVGGTLHWAPLGVRGLTDRMVAIADWIARMRPRVFVVDVSVEVAVFVRLLGVPVVVMAMPGERDDAPHRLAYQAATRIVAPWSQSVYDPTWLRMHADKTDYVGVVSRFAGRAHETVDDAPGVLVLGGAGGTALTARDIDDAAASDTRFDWAAVGLDASTWVDDVWPLLCSASVVVTHAGQNAIADVACAGTRAVVIPQHRPYDEQVATAAALAGSSVAVTAAQWPSAENWPRLLDDALALNPAAWKQVRQNGAAERAASAISRAVPS